MKAFIFGALILFIAAASANEEFYERYYDEFQNFKIKYDKVYKNEDEERLRLKIFAENVDEYKRRHHHDLDLPNYVFDRYSDLLLHEVPLVQDREFKPRSFDVKFMQKHMQNRIDWPTLPTFFAEDVKNDLGFQFAYDDEIPTIPPPVYPYSRKAKFRYQ